MAKAKNSELTYAEAAEELQEIIDQIEQDEISIDALSEKVNRAGFLIRFCKEKLVKTEGEIRQIMQVLQNPEE